MNDLIEVDEEFLGAHVSENGVAYRVWASNAESVSVQIAPEHGDMRRLTLRPLSAGYHIGTDLEGRSGDRYHFLLDNSGPYPDPASRAQHSDVQGDSIVVDASSFHWTDSDYQRPPFRDLVIYELHIGTFTAKGTFSAVLEHLAYLKALGVTAIEIMPIADFPGERNWGYDGVLLYAPAHCYGSPDDLRALVDASHARGLAVILDVVYNHFGPDGNLLPKFSDYYFSTKHTTPWGAALNFDGEASGPVREFFLSTPRYWMTDFHIDGFRFDAAHEIVDDSALHILAEMTDAIHEQGGYAMAEDERNEFLLITPTAEGGYGFDAVWADDFHHSTRVSLTGEQAAYFANFGGTPREIARTLRQGWLYSGEIQKIPAEARGTQGAHLPPQRFIHCISNHDQVGNRALGERLHQLTNPCAYRTLSALLCLSPYTPLIFMGQEWAASTPFLFFTDHSGELGEKITAGRKKEFASFEEFNQESEQDSIPDPQEVRTFLKSKLQWEEVKTSTHAQTLKLYSDCLNVRATHQEYRPARRQNWQIIELNWGALAIHYRLIDREHLVVFDLSGGHGGSLPAPTNGARWDIELNTEASHYGGTESTTYRAEVLTFERPGLVVMHCTPTSENQEALPDQTNLNLN